MYHSLTFFEDFEEISTTSELDGSIAYTGTRLKNPINTWDDWHLVPTSRPVINPPNVRTSEVIIPGRSGSLDLSEVLTGYPLFDNRTGSIEFIVMNDYWDWSIAYSTIMRHLHGKTFKMMLEDDPAYYYEGRFSVNTWKSDKNWSLITIDYNVQPYKLSRQSISEDWLWDPFSFENGVIYDTTSGITGKISLDTDHTASLSVNYGSNHTLTYYNGGGDPNISSDIAETVLYAKDNHEIPSIVVSKFDTAVQSVRLPCIIYFVGGSVYDLGDALYSFVPYVTCIIDVYDSVSDYEAEFEPTATYSIDIAENGTYQDASWAMPAGGVAVIRSVMKWKWTRSDATFSNNLNFEKGISNAGLYVSAKYDPNDNPVWLSLTEPYYKGRYVLNTYTIGDYGSYSDYITDMIGEDHSIAASATVSVDYRGGVL